MTEETKPLEFGKANLTEDEMGAITAVLVAASRADTLRSADDRPRSARLGPRRLAYLPAHLT